MRWKGQSITAEGNGDGGMRVGGLKTREGNDVIPADAPIRDECPGWCHDCKHLGDECDLIVFKADIKAGYLVIYDCNGYDEVESDAAH